MAYDLNDPNLDFDIEQEAIINALKGARGDRRMMAPELTGRSWAPGSSALGGIGAALTRAAGGINESRAMREQRDLAGEQQRRMEALQQELVTPGTKRVRVLQQTLGPDMPEGQAGPPEPVSEEVEQTVPLNPLEENNRRMGVALRMTKLPQARAAANSIIQQSIGFPEKFAQLQEKGRERLQELQLRLQDRGLDRASREGIMQQIDDTKRWIAQLNANTQIGLQGMRNAVAELKAGQKPDGKPLTNAETTSLVKIKEAGDTLAELNKSWKPDNAGWGAVGEVVRKLDSTLGSWGTENMQARNEWWSKYEMLVELPTRNAMFGSALTAPERALWNQARMVKPGADPDKVRKAVQDMQAIAEKKLAMVGESFVKGGKSKGAVEAITGGVPSDFEVIKR